MDLCGNAIVLSVDEEDKKKENEENAENFIVSCWMYKRNWF